ncbi:hypothetical protein EYF80_050070 [Liparis tanakae]|uniref:Uncharacterized protein n=1 Tax=Liparis tanakae TaxID=230148 RepID=A0A4Z2FFP1_9TELE|nr:hypothetical protein EYF80_050070 [Liparis tanakae]
MFRQAAAERAGEREKCARREGEKVQKKTLQNLPGDITRCRPMKNADPGVDSQSREDMRRRSRRLEEEDKTAMMLERETEGRMRGTHL